MVGKSKGDFMNGGLIEGLKKLYIGNDVLKRHLFILLIAVITVIPFAFVQGEVDTSSNLATLKQLAEVGPWAVILYLGGLFFLGLYAVHFTHNALKFFLWADHQDDPEKTKSLDIAPKFDKNIMNHAGNILIYYICLMVVLFIVILPVALVAWIPIIGWGLLILVALVISISAPYLVVGFSKNYDMSKNISPTLLFQYFPQIFLPTLVLGIKMFVLWIGAFIGGLILAFIIGAAFSAFHEGFVTCIAASVMLYILYIVTLAYQYAIAYIYYDRIELNKEI